MIAGNADIAFCGPEAIYLAADKGSELKAVYDIYPVNVFNVFALKSKQIITPQDLKGKKVGVISMASGTRYNLATILALERDERAGRVSWWRSAKRRAGNHRRQGRRHGLDRPPSSTACRRPAFGAVDVIWARDYLQHARPTCSRSRPRITSPRRT